MHERYNSRLGGMAEVQDGYLHLTLDLADLLEPQPTNLM